MTREELEAFRNAYQKAAKKSIKAKNKNGKVINEQSDWVWFDRNTIQKLLDMTDSEKGGIKIYFGQYDENNVNMLPEDMRKKHDYVGRVSLALAACNKTETEFEDIYSASNEIQNTANLMLLRSNDRDSPVNAGTVCPPICNP
ncbi:hypothetical protein SAMN00777080_1267 [Aquiflexum balticum DSM 16537]|uniref:Uncharacterized protein n=1 Tax=Aquiflexum balticum DSM 16537 TaxID=758820 RepID=A0A1W2H180_9BACT|nr:hypothetical protein [Aquiflexum balticum]SMD42705.1 hypothetical protein SAMN00777080_1267 [Aquiflexum balticum DSM 16537]